MTNNSSGYESMFRSCTPMNETGGRYMVCLDAPPHIVSDGLWSDKDSGRTPMKSFLSIFQLQVLLIFALTQICRLIIKPFGIPLFISQMMAGLMLHGCFVSEPMEIYMKKLFPYGSHDTISTISAIGFVLYIFVNGVQMDVSLIRRMGKRAWMIAIAGLVLPIFCAMTATLLLGNKLNILVVAASDNFAVAFLSHIVVSFAVIASMLTELKIQNSELGKLALSSAMVSDVICAFLIAVGSGLAKVKDDNHFIVGLKILGPLLAMFILIPLLCRPAMFWIIRHTPEGRPVKDGYIYLIIVMLLMFGWLAVEIKQEFVLGAFIFGLSVPEGPPLGTALIKKLNFFGTTFLLPIFVTLSMLKVDYTLDYASAEVWGIALVVIVAHLIRIISCMIPALHCNMPLRDALSLALILNSKGVVEIGLYCYLHDKKVIDGQTFGTMIVSIIVVASIMNWGVKLLYDPSRKYAGYKKGNVTMLKGAWSELRMVVCIHKYNHISPMIDVIELCGPTAENPIVVEVLHLIELVGRAVPIFIAHGLQRQSSGYQKSYSDDIVLAFDIYQHDNPHAISAFPCTAISPPNLMYEDVCNLAFDKNASIIILPFHQRWSHDGVVESDDKNIRALNNRVLEIAPCSVGILVTRCSLQNRDHSSMRTQLAMIYLGGPDDEEALCIAKKATRNPGTYLVVYHLVVKEELELDEEGKEEDEELKEVKYGEKENIGYQQIVTREGAETAAFLGEVVKQHDFFIVGRRNGFESIQTEGLTNWTEFPELGVIGDFLASPDLDSRASILVVQQQLSLKKDGWLF